MGGEKFCAPSLVCCHTGSPPHGRGKVRLQEQDCRSGGITPAWAGKSHLTGGDRVLLRITPAWAGKSPFQTWSVPHSRDHPRMGGEKSAFAMLRALVFGSPPHGRGKVGTVTAALGDLGITPAWAGKSGVTAALMAYYGDHPRMGGEKPSTQPQILPQKGSPPHGRGKVSGFYYLTFRAGITPAWAGKRLKRSHRSGIFISGPIPFHSVLHRPAGSGGSRAGRDGSPAGQPQNAGPA